MVVIYGVVALFDVLPPLAFSWSSFCTIRNVCQALFFTPSFFHFFPQIRVSPSCSTTATGK